GCDECGMDPERLSVDDAIVAIYDFGPKFRAAFVIADGDAGRLRAKHDPAVWSALEYAMHVGDVVRYHGWLANRALMKERPFVPSPDPDAVARDENYNE